AEGLQAIEWFKQKEFLKIAEYCCFDVKITKLVHEYGSACKQVFYNNKFGTKMSVEVDW
ncbi:MAG TPA: helicase, partial [Verrucomicrobiales bacterium]|nr:helicase [Verrucomicrobiales bacterium]